MTIKAKNWNKWRKTTMKTEGYIVNHLSTPGHCPSTSHLYIKVTHHEWNNSKEERFPLWLQGLLFVFECSVVIISSHLFDRKDSHTTKTDLHFYGILNTGNSESCLCSSITYTLQFNIWRHSLLELLYNVECTSISGHKVTNVTKQMHDLAVTCRNHHP